MPGPPHEGLLALFFMRGTRFLGGRDRLTPVLPLRFFFLSGAFSYLSGKFVGISGSFDRPPDVWKPLPVIDRASGASPRPLDVSLALGVFPLPN